MTNSEGSRTALVFERDSDDDDDDDPDNEDDELELEPSAAFCWQDNNVKLKNNEI
jgi:hypothetical protein